MFEEPFVGRENQLASLATILFEQVKGRRNVFVAGRRKVGKTALFRQFKRLNTERIVLLVNLEHIVSSPKLFARNFVCQLVAQLLGVEVPYSVGCEQVHELIGQCEDELQSELRPLLALLDEERPDHEEILAAALEVPAHIAKVRDERVVVLLDNFENLLNLNSYPELKRLDRCISDVWKFHDGVAYAVAGAKGSQLEVLFKKSGFWQRKFQKMLLEPLSREETYFLASSIFGIEGRPVPREVLPTFFYYSKGIPFYVHALFNRTLQLSRREGRAVDQKLLNRAFVLEVLREDGLIHSVCHSMFFDGIAAVSGENSLRAVLQVLATEEGLHLADVGRRIGRPNGQVHGYLKALLAADLLFLDDKRFYYRDPIVRFFVSQNMFNNFTNLEHDEELANRLARRFFEQFIIGRPDLGFELEFRVKLLASYFDGRVVDGRPMGCVEPVKRPERHEDTFLIDFDSEGSLHGAPSMVVSDLCLRGRRQWMVEIHRNDDLVDVKDLQEIQKKRRFFEGKGRQVFDRLWIISSIGFTEACRELAREQQVLLSAEDELQQIETALFEKEAA